MVVFKSSLLGQEQQVLLTCCSFILSRNYTRRPFTVWVCSISSCITSNEVNGIPENDLLTSLKIRCTESMLHMSLSSIVLHQYIVVKLTTQLGTYAEEAGAGYEFVAPTDVVFSDHNIGQSDVIFVSKERRSIITEKTV